MGWENRDLNSYVILDLAVFITGFLTGILAFAVLHVSSDVTTLSVIIFTLGFITGTIAIVLAVILLRRRKQLSS